MHNPSGGSDGYRTDVRSRRSPPRRSPSGGEGEPRSRPWRLPAGPVAPPTVPPGRSPISVAVERVARESFLQRPDERVAARTVDGYPHRPLLRFVRVPPGSRRRSDPPTGFVVHLLASTCESSPISSSGVHRIGASQPARRHTASTSGRFSALAICAEFQVKRYETPWVAAMAMCKASARAFEGKAAPFNKARASISASAVVSSDRRAAKKVVRRTAAAGSPSAHSRWTSSETTTSKELRRRLHHSWVSCCRPATIKSREGHAVR